MARAPHYYNTPGRKKPVGRNIVANRQWSKSGAVPVEESITYRVEQIGRLDDRRMRLVACGDREGLMKLAEEYRVFGAGMPKTAEEVRRLAERM